MLANIYRINPKWRVYSMIHVTPRNDDNPIGQTTEINVSKIATKRTWTKLTKFIPKFTKTIWRKNSWSMYLKIIEIQRKNVDSWKETCNFDFLIKYRSFLRNLNSDNKFCAVLQRCMERQKINVDSSGFIWKEHECERIERGRVENHWRRRKLMGISSRLYCICVLSPANISHDIAYDAACREERGCGGWRSAALCYAPRVSEKTRTYIHVRT